MTFNDIFKSDFLENVTAVSIPDMLITLVLAFCLGLLIFFVYKKTYQGVMYSSSFATTLVALTMITAIVIMAISTNVVLSLGMVGALSIVRFRTAIKEPLDIAFLFWSIAAGIVLAAGMIPLAVVGSIAVAVMLLIFVNRKTTSNPYIAVVRCTDEAAASHAEHLIKASTQRAIVKSKGISPAGIEVNTEVRLKDGGTEFVSQLMSIPGVKSAVLVSYNGDYQG